MGSTMTDKTEAQPEALRLADALYSESDRQSKGVKYSTAKKSAAELRRLHDELQQLKAQLSARQAAPDAIGHVRIDSGEVHIYPRNRDAESSGLVDGQLVYAAAPPPPEREPMTDDGRYTITIEHGSAQARFVITEMQFESAHSPAKYVGQAVAKAIAAIDKRRVSHGIGATNG